MTDPFGDYHRRTGIVRAARTVITVVSSAALVLGLAALASGAPDQPVASAPMEPQVAGAYAPARLPEPPSAEPGQPVSIAPTPPPGPLLVLTGPRDWSIDIDTTGYQAEIDACLWVRMDLGLSAPIVGAHNYCGGGVVLEMVLGDRVTLSGTALDGAYTVVADRAARSGDNAVTATAGLEGDVILQTCLWSNDGRVRLVVLQRA